jgi:hypothetical protein
MSAQFREPRGKPDTEKEAGDFLRLSADSPGKEVPAFESIAEKVKAVTLPTINVY